MKNAPGSAVLKFGAGEEARPMVPKMERRQEDVIVVV
jgi:hypothetical protein